MTFKQKQHQTNIEKYLKNNNYSILKINCINRKTSYKQENNLLNFLCFSLFVALNWSFFRNISREMTCKKEEKKDDERFGKVVQHTLQPYPKCIRNNRRRSALKTTQWLYEKTSSIFNRESYKPVSEMNAKMSLETRRNALTFLTLNPGEKGTIIPPDEIDEDEKKKDMNSWTEYFLKRRNALVLNRKNKLQQTQKIDANKL